jgi:hypothetical protein
MTFRRIRTIKGERYLYSQTSVRKGKKVRSIMKYLGAIDGAIAGVGLGISIARDAMEKDKPRSFSGNRPTDQRHIRHQDESDRELFHKNRGRFNVKQAQDFDREDKRGQIAKGLSDKQQKERDEHVRSLREKHDKWERGTRGPRRAGGQVERSDEGVQGFSGASIRFRVRAVCKVMVAALMYRGSFIAVLTI